jgi:GntR family transcriptional repressor for pyruvate dehydrogenase complex
MEGADITKSAPSLPLKAKPDEEFDSPIELGDALTSLAGGVSDPAYERVAVVLRHALTLRIFPGDRLPPERFLAESLGVSRITVRQAVVILQSEGMVNPGPHRRAGTMTGPLRRPQDAQSLEAFRREIRDILNFRTILETAATRLAVESQSDGLVEHLRRSIEENRCSCDPSEFRRTDTDFHLAIAQASGNRRLMGAILTARAEFLHYRDLHPMTDNVEENVRDHIRIVDAIEARDVSAAAEAMTEHLQSSLLMFLLSVDDSGARGNAKSKTTSRSRAGRKSVTT